MTDHKQHKILLVDDTEIHIRALIEALHDEYELYVVLDGESALNHVRVRMPDIILLDVVMPGMNGFEVCRILKKDEFTRNIPVIFLTALDELEDKTAGFEAGAVDYITKPFDPLEVRARVMTHLELKHSNEALKRINEQLNSEIMDRMRAEDALKKAHDELERRVEARTAELLKSNSQLIHEIDEHKQTLAHLKESEERYRLLTENVADGVCIIQEGNLVFVNPAFASIFSYSEDHLLEKDLAFLVSSEHRKAFRDIFRKIDKNPRAENFQFSCICGDSRKIWIEGHPNIIQWEGGDAVLLTIRDITTRKLREIAIEEERAELLREVADLRATVKDCYRFGDIIGKSPNMKKIYKRIIDAAASDADVIIYGESGTGKELIARTIHRMSRRQQNTFVPVNCGAIPEPLFESEFFGYRKGAFTGADKNKPGFFDIANRGTLFLDEVGELGHNMQVKLLRVLEDGAYTPLGDVNVKKADVRIISATNYDLAGGLKKGHLRKDFFYRIHVIPIHVPPLRERKEDIPLLTDHFLKLHNDERDIRHLPGNILETLYNHPWLGNVRELKNVLKRYITLNCIDFDIFQIPSLSREPVILPEEGLQDALADFEREFISKTLEYNSGHRGRTAKMIGVTERTLYRKLKQYLLLK
ncbi:sigma-54-dependent Fis family transcriptional regulator [Desulfococcaceae bacterium HSG8]|nr:sigma-54-dependent Fis family transcriptional regulator [Desulfococcaceae bacterium HSG8]